MFGANNFGSVYFGQAYPGLSIAVPLWVSPINGAANVTQITDLVFLIPQAASPIHFELQIDSASTFDSSSLLDIKSYQLLTGWQYWSGSSWVSIPNTGIDPSFAGNQAKYTLQSPLGTGVWYRRIRGRILL